MSEDLLREAQSLASQGQLARAADVCVSGLRNGFQSELLEALVGYLEALDFQHEALEQLYRLYELEPERPGLKSRLLWLALEAGRPDVAAPLIDEFASISSKLKGRKEPNLSFGYAFLLYDPQQYEDAVDRFCQLLTVPEWSAWAHNMLGLCHYRMGALEPSLHHFSQALQRVARDEQHQYRELHFNLACALYGKGSLVQSLASLRRLSIIDPDYPELQQWMREIELQIRGGDADPLCGSASKPRPKPPNLRGGLLG